MHDLGKYIEKIKSSDTPENAFNSYCTIMKAYGYDRVVYSLLTDHPSLNLPRQHGFASSYPEDWINHYNEVGYLDHDPVADELLKTLQPFFWNDLLKRKELSNLSAQVMNQCEESGVHSGLAFSMPGKFGEVTAFGLAKNDKENTQLNDYNTLASLHLLSIYFHETFREMHVKTNQIHITPREKEILLWASEGKSDDDIADILTINVNTVRFHWKNIFEKLNAPGRTFAVTKALRLDLIDPMVFTTTYRKQ